MTLLVQRHYEDDDYGDEADEGPEATLASDDNDDDGHVEPDSFLRPSPHRLGSS
jgi:hypothetical protein